MFRTLTAAAIAGAALFAPAAGAEPIVEGCYGAETLVVCDPDLTYGVPVGVETYQDEVTLCVGECRDYTVTLVRTTAGDPVSVCVTTQDRTGTPTTRCASVPPVPPTQPYVDLVLDRVEYVQDYVADVRDATADEFDDLHDELCDPYDNVPLNCNGGHHSVLNAVEDLIRGS